MGSEVKYCCSCEKTKDNTNKLNIQLSEFSKGYIIGFSEEITQCPYCKNPVTDISITSDEFFCLRDTSNYNRELLQAMIELKEKDPIEFQLKMSQFRALQNQPQSRAEQSTDKITCPKCGSTAIDSGTRGFTLTAGFLGSGNHRNVCKKCGYKWKPGSWAETRDRHLYGNK